MIMRKDGKSHIIHGDCFDPFTLNQLKGIHDTAGNPVIFNKGLLNPPYSQKIIVNLNFWNKSLVSSHKAARSLLYAL